LRTASSRLFSLRAAELDPVRGRAARQGPRAPLGMRRWLGCLALVAGCSGGGGERVVECDALMATLARGRACDRLDPAQRAQLGSSTRQLEEALDRLADVGPGWAPAGLLDEAKRTCARLDSEIRRAYEKDAPDCLR
jgi:hypothetical protein